MISIVQIALFIIGLINQDPSRVTELQQVQAQIVQDLNGATQATQTTQPTDTTQTNNTPTQSSGQVVTGVPQSSGITISQPYCVTENGVSFPRIDITAAGQFDVGAVRYERYIQDTPNAIPKADSPSTVDIARFTASSTSIDLQNVPYKNFHVDVRTYVGNDALGQSVLSNEKEIVTSMETPCP